jgi:small subunit ribosomal protein S7
MVQKNYKNNIVNNKFNSYRLKKNKIIFNNLNKKLNKYNSTVLLSEKFIKCLMLKGKKSISEKIFFNIFVLLQTIFTKNIVFFFKCSLINSSLIISTYKIKKKKRILREIPFLLSLNKRIIWAVKNIIKIINLQVKNCFITKFKNEIIKVLKKNSEILVKKNEMHLLALKNKAYAHFRWF